LQQIVWNIASNAIKFTPKGGRVELRLELVSEPEGAHVEIIVSDSGQGIRAELLPFVFDRFRQGDSLSARTQGGLGLGLAIVRHLVELHGGSVKAESSGEGNGATFKVKLPLAVVRSELRDASRANAIALGEMAERALPQLGGMKVMVIDDDRDSREVLKIMIEQFGAEVKTCVSSAEAFDALLNWNPDILISDIEMPGENGLQLLEKIRSLNRENGGRVPAIALTVYASAEDRRRALSAGYQMHIAKPAEPVELARIIAELVAREGKGFAG
jgi:CheY-like chemotaxis protein/anti-sigma regulatory factor (Ser/Thr protein kinase)